MTSAKQDFYYLGICPFLSSENVLARSRLGLAHSELNCAEIARIVQENGKVTIPSHFWWRTDCLELLKGLHGWAAQISIQCGPGFELTEKHTQILRALELGFGVQIICQKRLSYSQENRLIDFLTFRNLLEINFFIEESDNPFGDFRFFCEKYLDLLSISMTKFSFSLLSELAASQPEIQHLKFLSFADQTSDFFTQTLERTRYGKMTLSFRSTSFRFPIKQFLKLLSSTISYLFLPKLDKWQNLFVSIYWLTYRFFMSYPFWPFRKFFWIAQSEFRKRILRRHED